MKYLFLLATYVLLAGCNGRTSPGKDDLSGKDFRGEGMNKDGGDLNDFRNDSNGCVPEGKYLNNLLKQKCCHGFIAILDKSAGWKGKCEEPSTKQYLCTQCGDRICRTRETVCNCPVDCKCYGEGDQFENLTGDPNEKCCSDRGLVAAELRTPTSAGTCAKASCKCYVCVKCGDNVCGKGENLCTCFADCKK
jgi:hypothetical protein